MIGDELCRDIEKYAEELRGGELLSLARAGLLPPSAVGRYLASIHFLLTYTPVHLRLAAELARGREQEELARYFEQKLGEEDAHDRWAESDREVLEDRFGVDAVQGPAEAMRRLVAATRERIEHDPVSYLAYILFAEYFTVIMGPEWTAALQGNCGVPASALTSVSHHIELDKHHAAEGREVIENLADDPAYYPSLKDTLRATMENFTAFCDELCQAA